MGFSEMNYCNKSTINPKKDFSHNHFLKNILTGFFSTSKVINPLFLKKLL